MAVTVSLGSTLRGGLLFSSTFILEGERPAARLRHRLSPDLLRGPPLGRERHLAPSMQALARTRFPNNLQESLRVSRACLL